MVTDPNTQDKPTLSLKSVVESVNLPGLLKRCCFTKRSGATPMQLLMAVVCSVFYGADNIYRLYT